MEIHQLIMKAKKGNGAAFLELIQDKKEHLYRIAYCYVKNEQDALDIVSEAVTKAFSSLHGLKKPEYFHTWLTRILINAAIDYQRKIKPLIPITQEIHDTPSPESVDKEEVMDLYQAIDQLEGRLKSIIILKYLEDKTITEIAELLKMPVGTVKTYLNRALKQLRLDLKEEVE